MNFGNMFGALGGALGKGGSGIGPSMGAMGQGVPNKFVNQPAQTPQFGNLGQDAAQLMGGSMPPQQPQMGNMAPGMGGIGPSNFQDLIRKLLGGMGGGGGTMQPMGGNQPMGNMQTTIPQQGMMRNWGG